MVTCFLEQVKGEHIVGFNFSVPTAPLLNKKNPLRRQIWRFK